MITKVVLENFMAHAHTELDLGPGINALTGPNNTGKSAIVEALRCVATNPVPKHYIRHGAKEARVTVELEDGTRVIWVRKKRSSGYELWSPGAEEVQEYWKFGRKPPEDILAALRMNLVELEGDKDPLDVHIGNQRDPVFLLNQPKSDAAAFFASSTESAHLLAMQNLLKRKTQDAKRQEKELNKRISTVENEIDQFAPLPDIEMALETARELEASAKDFQTSIPALESIIIKQADLAQSVVDQTLKATVLKSMNNVPSIHDTRVLSGIIHQITSVTSGLVHSERRALSLSSLLSSPELYNTDRLAMFCEELQRVGSGLSSTLSLQAISGDLTPPPVIDSLHHLPEMIDELIACMCRLQREKRRQCALQEVSEPPLLEKLDHLQGLLSEVAHLSEQVESAEKGLNKLEMGLQMLENSIASRLDELGRCPTCGGEMSVVEFLDRGCRHGS